MSDTTPPLDDFRAAYDADDNVWWATACGHHQNLFEAACDQVDELRAELAAARATIARLAERIEAADQDIGRPDYKVLGDLIQDARAALAGEQP
jgi:hypothetical protein